MKAISNLVSKLTGGAKTETIGEPTGLVILFHKDCNGHIEHGSIFASHAMHNLKNYPVRFGFRDVDAPNLTPELYAYIVEEAQRQGFDGADVGDGKKEIYLRSYANLMPVMPRPQKILEGEAQRNPNRQSLSRPVRRPHGEDRHKPREEHIGGAGVPKVRAA